MTTPPIHPPPRLSPQFVRWAALSVFVIFVYACLSEQPYRVPTPHSRSYSRITQRQYRSLTEGMDPIDVWGVFQRSPDEEGKTLHGDTELVKRVWRDEDGGGVVIYFIDGKLESKGATGLK